MDQASTGFCPWLRLVTNAAGPRRSIALPRHWMVPSYQLWKVAGQIGDFRAPAAHSSGGVALAPVSMAVPLHKSFPPIQCAINPTRGISLWQWRSCAPTTTIRRRSFGGFAAQSGFGRFVNPRRNSPLGFLHWTASCRSRHPEQDRDHTKASR